MNRVVPLVLAVALFMENVDSTVISTSLPAIAEDIGTSPISLKLALTSYLVALAIFIPVSGWMADRFGGKQVFRAAIGLFILGSIACAASYSLGSFVLARFFQGMGGAMMTPVARLLLVRSTARSDLVSAMAWLSIPAMVGPLFGPPLGGFITTYFSWHWIFLINVPIGIIGMICVTKFLPDDGYRHKRRLDTVGLLLSGLGLSGIVFGMSVISLPALPPYTGLLIFIIGVICSCAYIWHARRSISPLLDLSLFNNQVFSAAVLGGSIFRIGIGALPFLLPLMLQVSFGLTPFHSGMLTFVSAIGAISMKFGARRLFMKFGFRDALMYGSLIAAGFIAINGFFTPATPYWLIALMLLLGGFVRSMFFTGVNALGFAEIPNERISQATPISAVVQQASIAIGVAIAGGVLELSTNLSGGEMTLYDFHISFYIVAIISAMAFFVFKRLPPDAGHEVSGGKK